MIERSGLCGDHTICVGLHVLHVSEDGLLWLWLCVWGRCPAAELIWDQSDVSLMLPMMDKTLNIEILQMIQNPKM